MHEHQHVHVHGHSLVGDGKLFENFLVGEAACAALVTPPMLLDVLVADHPVVFPVPVSPWYRDLNNIQAHQLLKIQVEEPFLFLAYSCEREAQ